MFDVPYSIVEEELGQIGEKLRGAREAAGLTIDDVVHQAHFPRSVVEALEADDFSVFSSPTYAKSFLSQYSGFLGVDARPWLDALAPVMFVGSGETLGSLIDSRFIPVEGAPKRESGNFLSAVLLLLLSGALVFAGVKGYRFLDMKLAEMEAGEKEIPPPVAEKTETPPETEEQELPDPGTPDEELALPPPRAIIVRD